MKIDRVDFLKAVNSVYPICTKKSRVAHSERITFFKNRLYATNGNMSASERFEFPEPVELAVDGLKLHSALNLLTTSTIEVDATETHFILKSGKTKITLSVYDIQKNSVLYIDATETIPLPSDYFDAIALSNIQNNKSNLEGIVVSGMRAVSSDKTKQIRYIELSEDAPNFWIDGESASTLNHYGNIFTDYAVSDSHVLFYSDTIILAFARKNDMTYPLSNVDYYYDIGKKDANTVYPLPKDLITIVKNASQIVNTENKAKMITVSISPYDIAIEASSGGVDYNDAIIFSEPIEIGETSFILDSTVLLGVLPFCDSFAITKLQKDAQTVYTMLTLYGKNSIFMLNTN